jgi:DNA-binding transcriptional ArsR family regulator
MRIYMDNDIYKDVVKLQLIFQTLSDSSRLKILKYINDKECSVTQITEGTRLSQPLVSHHLRTLRERQILETNRDGPFIYYRIKDKRLLEIFSMILEVAGPLDAGDVSNSFSCGPMKWK